MRRDGTGEKDDSNADSTEPPSLSERIEASDDFRGALEQSTGLLSEHRRALLVLVLVSLIITGMVIVYPRLF